MTTIASLKNPGSSPPSDEMARLYRAGFSLLPLGGGADGKAPLLRAWAGPGLTLARILAPMHRAGSQAYRVRLDGLAVIDVDSDDPDLVAKIEARFPAVTCGSWSSRRQADHRPLSGKGRT